MKNSYLDQISLYAHDMKRASKSSITLEWMSQQKLDVIELVSDNWDEITGNIGITKKRK